MSEQHLGSGQTSCWRFSDQRASYPRLANCFGIDDVVLELALQKGCLRDLKPAPLVAFANEAIERWLEEPQTEARMLGPSVVAAEGAAGAAAAASATAPSQRTGGTHLRPQRLFDLLKWIPGSIMCFVCVAGAR